MNEPTDARDLLDHALDLLTTKSIRDAIAFVEQALETERQRGAAQAREQYERELWAAAEKILAIVREAKKGLHDTLDKG